jgi:hypothetical protein
MGYQRYGVPQSGAMDMLTFAIACMLVGNPLDEAAIEFTGQAQAAPAAAATAQMALGDQRFHVAMHRALGTQAQACANLGQCGRVAVLGNVVSNELQQLFFQPGEHGCSPNVLF